MNIYEKLMNVQSELKTPKNQYNSFGKYNYRNLEDILEGLKPLLTKHKAIINISDEVVLIGERYYIKSIATFIDVENEGSITIDSIAYAREDDSKKGMDLSQLSGSTASYARKYALNGLFAIDDTKDSDTTNTHGKEPNAPVKTQPKPPIKTEPKEPIKLSEALVQALYKLAESKKIDSTMLEKSIKDEYMKNNANELTKQEYDHLVARLEKVKGEE